LDDDPPNPVARAARKIGISAGFFVFNLEAFDKSCQELGIPILSKNRKFLGYLKGSGKPP